MPVHLCNYLGNSPTLGGAHAQKGPCGSHKKRRVNSMAGNVPNHSVKMVVLAFQIPQKIKIITSNFVACNIFSCDIKAWNFRTLLWKKTFLDFTGQCQ